MGEKKRILLNNNVFQACNVVLLTLCFFRWTQYIGFNSTLPSLVHILFFHVALGQLNVTVRFNSIVLHRFLYAINREAKPIMLINLINGY